jgi:hypothetical protein
MDFEIDGAGAHEPEVSESIFEFEVAGGYKT